MPACTPDTRSSRQQQGLTPHARHCLPLQYLAQWHACPMPHLWTVACCLRSRFSLCWENCASLAKPRPTAGKLGQSQGLGGETPSRLNGIRTVRSSRSLGHDTPRLLLSAQVTTFQAIHEHHRTTCWVNSASVRKATADFERARETRYHGVQNDYQHISNIILICNFHKQNVPGEIKLLTEF